MGSIDRFTTVQGFAANHEQGRANRIRFSKEQRAVYYSRFLAITLSENGIFSRRIFVEIYCGALDKSKKVVSEKHSAAPAKNLRLNEPVLDTVHRCFGQQCSVYVYSVT